MNLEKFRENYRNFDNERIVKIAKNDIKILRPEIIEILKDEIKKRELPSELITNIDREYNMVKKRFEKKEFRGYLGAKIVELNSEDMEITLHSGYSKTGIIAKLATDSMNKLNIKFSDVRLIYKGSGILDDNAYKIMGKNANGEKIEKTTLLHLLGSKDRDLLFQILKKKGVNIKV